MNINLTLEKFKQDLVNVINNCNLPIGVACLVIKDIYFSLEQQYTKALKDEAQRSEEDVILEIK